MVAWAHWHEFIENSKLFGELISEVGENSAVGSNHSDNKVNTVISSGKVKAWETSVDVFSVIQIWLDESIWVTVEVMKKG